MSVSNLHNVTIRGRGSRSIVFAHGFGCDQNMWRYVSPAFEQDFQTVLFDNAGAGKSDPSHFDFRRYATLDGYAEDVESIVRELSLDRPIFVGHSVSAMIGILALKLNPKLFSALVLVGPSPCYINDGDYVGGFTREQIEDLLTSLEDNHHGWSTTMAPTIMGNAERPELGQELTASFCGTDPEIAQHFARATFLSDHREALGPTSIPTLILQCSEDVIAPTCVGEFMKDAMPGSQLVLMKATGHCPNLSAPRETIAAIQGFL